MYLQTWFWSRCQRHLTSPVQLRNLKFESWTVTFFWLSTFVTWFGKLSSMISNYIWLIYCDILSSFQISLRIFNVLALFPLLLLSRNEHVGHSEIAYHTAVFQLLLRCEFPEGRCHRLTFEKGTAFLSMKWGVRREVGRENALSFPELQSIMQGVSMREAQRTQHSLLSWRTSWGWQTLSWPKDQVPRIGRLSGSMNTKLPCSGKRRTCATPIVLRDLPVHQPRLHKATKAGTKAEIRFEIKRK